MASELEVWCSSAVEGEVRTPVVPVRLLFTSADARRRTVLAKVECFSVAATNLQMIFSSVPRYALYDFPLRRAPRVARIFL